MKAIIFLTLLFSPLLLQNTYACSCEMQTSIYSEIGSYDNIFIAKIIRSNNQSFEKTRTYRNGENKTYTETYIRYDVEVIETFKGENKGIVTINLGPETMCTGELDIGETYLLYSIKNHFSSSNIRSKENLNQVALLCSFNSYYRSAKDQIYFIKRFLNGKKEPIVYGSVAIDKLNIAKSNYEDEFLKDVVVQLVSEEKTISTKTNQDGIFLFDNVPDGKYQINYVYSNHYEPHNYPTKIEVFRGNIKTGSIFGGALYTSNNGYYEKNYLRFNTKVSGNVLDANNVKVKSVNTGLIPITNPLSKIPNYLSPTRFDARKFDIKGKKPDQYYLVSEILAPFENNDKTRVFYPNTLDQTGAKLINLLPTNDLNLDMILPRSLVTSVIKGKIVWNDGEAVNNSYVALRKGENTKFSSKMIDNYDFVSTDQNGNFELQGFVNATYWIHASISVEIESENSKKKFVRVDAKPVRLKVIKKNKVINIVLQKPNNIKRKI